MEDNEKIPQNTKKRKTSFFRNRKKSDIRPFVREHKSRQSKKFFVYIFTISLVLFVASGMLLLIKEYALPKIFTKKAGIINPLGSAGPDRDAILKSISQNNLEADNVVVASTSSVATFTLKNKIQVLVSLKKDISSQINLVKAIEREMTLTGKQAISIDLRYNKPIVKF